jgi:hypothetical protein
MMSNDAATRTGEMNQPAAGGLAQADGGIQAFGLIDTAMRYLREHTRTGRVMLAAASAFGLAACGSEAASSNPTGSISASPGTIAPSPSSSSTVTTTPKRTPNQASQALIARYRALPEKQYVALLSTERLMVNHSLYKEVGANALYNSCLSVKIGPGKWDYIWDFNPTTEKNSSGQSNIASPDDDATKIVRSSLIFPQSLAQCVSEESSVLMTEPVVTPGRKLDKELASQTLAGAVLDPSKDRTGYYAILKKKLAGNDWTAFPNSGFEGVFVQSSQDDITKPTKEEEAQGIQATKWVVLGTKLASSKITFSLVEFTDDTGEKTVAWVPSQLEKATVSYGNDK